MKNDINFEKENHETNKARLKRVLRDGILDNISCHGKIELDEEHLDNLAEEILEMDLR